MELSKQKMPVIILGWILLNVLSLAAGTCVLESEFGFILNCNFKKSGLFRVRNLGGLKAHFGLGFSLGDELGFGESLGNLEGNRRRALNYKTGFINKVGVASPHIDSSSISPNKFNHVINQNTSAMTEVMFLPLGVPTFRPIPKFTNNLVRRNDILINEGMPNFYYLPENLDKQVNTTNLSASNKTKIHSIDEQNSYQSLKNVSNSIYNKVNSVLVHTIDTNTQIQKPTVDGLHTTVQQQALKRKKSNDSSIRGSKGMLVMNAPKEYYPSGYDKNFDDNFKSKVNLPPTDFICAEQKYFPGLYANRDLGCMVFHVCAITDGGIIMKSFLCPESTLFDQSILKCNWWFYVDCNNSTYDSNIPISKSYQLMKSLSYFSNFTKMQAIDKEYSQKNVIKNN